MELHGHEKITLKHYLPPPQHRSILVLPQTPEYHSMLYFLLTVVAAAAAARCPDPFVVTQPTSVFLLPAAAAAAWPVLLFLFRLESESIRF